MKTRPQLIFGIDPSFRKDGFGMACLDLVNNDIDFKVFKNGFLDFSSWFLHEVPEDLEVLFVVENSNLQNKTFDMRGSKQVVASKSRSVGKNQAISQCVVDLIRTKYKVLNLSPRQKGKKWTPIAFAWQLKQNKIQNLSTKKKLSQDEIDAGQLSIIGKSRWYEAQ